MKSVLKGPKVQKVVPTGGKGREGRREDERTVCLHSDLSHVVWLQHVEILHLTLKNMREKVFLSDLQLIGQAHHVLRVAGHGSILSLNRLPIRLPSTKKRPSTSPILQVIISHILKTNTKNFPSIVATRILKAMMFPSVAARNETESAAKSNAARVTRAITQKPNVQALSIPAEKDYLIVKIGLSTNFQEAPVTQHDANHDCGQQRS